MQKRRHGPEFVDDMYLGVSPLRTAESAKPSRGVYIYTASQEWGGGGIGAMPKCLADYAAFQSHRVLSSGSRV